MKPLLVVLAFISLNCAVMPCSAQTKAADKDWSAVVEAAKKEGKVVVAGSPDPVMRNEVIPKFTARFGIQIEFIAGRSSQIVSRLETERGAGIYSIDVFLAGPDTTANELYGGKMIDPLKPLLVMPEVVDGSKWKMGKVWLADPEEQFVVRPFSSVATLLFINTDQVKTDELRNIKDLLNPKWRGKISSEDPTTTGAGANMAARLYNQIGEDFVKQLYIDQKTVRTRERRQMTDWLARGTQPICLNCREDDVRPLRQGGFQDCRSLRAQRHSRNHQWFAMDVVSGEQGATPEGRASLRQLDSLQGRARDLRKGLRLGDVAHRHRRVVSQSRQSTKKGREVF